ncbi:NodB homology domain-containing protein [Candidatus Hydrogenisulfobacillus filiaventi]|uniref:NodB homology domain-containing protein n=1 Tax=Candidatus Hydrogenisulfobacillus filiaventi TaxID=2707344 RepID=A0A6F8ZFL2_9FIRM|nr:polysaccharide deacetylase family protein [Bacillota bacterium]CAB1128779.1 NodB homology domain-containing protein [Candidatus Hydrogenisulfobacillus filiaventi]
MTGWGKRLRTWVVAGAAAAGLVAGVPVRAQAPPLPAAVPVYRVETAHPVMALSINVVWGTEYVPQLLAALKAAHAHATFMLGGRWAEQHADLARSLVQAGMEVGNHGWNHAHPSLQDPEALAADIRRSSAAIAAVTGAQPALYAPPYGELNPRILGAARANGLTLVMWTIDTIDWRPASDPATIVRRVLGRARPGAIVLMHPTDRTVEALPAVLKGLAAKGYQVVTVSDLLRTGQPRNDGE